MPGARRDDHTAIDFNVQIDKFMTEPKGIILYDGICILCSRWTRFVIARDPQGLFKFVPVQSDRGQAIAVSLGINPTEPETFAVQMAGKAFVKSSAIIAIVEQLPGWRWCRIFRIVPRPLLDWLYDRIARNRYRIFGKADTCIMPDAAMRQRFEDIETAQTRISGS
jgi:predicted DCC family thiol-disulfide oxidoreductase YuxK